MLFRKRRVGRKGKGMKRCLTLVVLVICKLLSGRVRILLLAFLSYCDEMGRERRLEGFV